MGDRDDVEQRPVGDLRPERKNVYGIQIEELPHFSLLTASHREQPPAEAGPNDAFRAAVGSGVVRQLSETIKISSDRGGFHSKTLSGIRVLRVIRGYAQLSRVRAFLSESLSHVCRREVIVSVHFILSFAASWASQHRQRLAPLPSPSSLFSASSALFIAIEFSTTSEADRAGLFLSSRSDNHHNRCRIETCPRFIYDNPVSLSLSLFPLFHKILGRSEHDDLVESVARLSRRQAIRSPITSLRRVVKTFIRPGSPIARILSAGT